MSTIPTKKEGFQCQYAKFRLHTHIVKSSFPKHNLQTWDLHLEPVFWRGTYRELEKSFSYTHIYSSHDTISSSFQIVAEMNIQQTLSIRLPPQIDHSPISFALFRSQTIAHTDIVTL